VGIYDQLEGMEEILSDFIIETNELVEQLDQDLLVLESETADQEAINRVFRAFHTIKGTSGFLNLADFTTVAHAAEDVLNKIRMGELTPSPKVVDAVFVSVDWFKNATQAVERRDELFQPTQPVLEKFHGIFADDEGVETTAAAPVNTEDEFDALFAAANAANKAADEAEQKATNADDLEEEDFDALFAAANAANKAAAAAEELEKAKAIANKDDDDPEETLDLAAAPGELVSEYISEAIEILETISGILIKLDATEDREDEFSISDDVVNDLFRAFHTLKGNSSLLGFMPISKVAHKAEDYMGLLQEGDCKPDPAMVDAFLDVSDWMLAVIKDLQKGTPKPFRSGRVIAQLERLICHKEQSQKIIEPEPVPVVKATKPAVQPEPITRKPVVVPGNGRAPVETLKPEPVLAQLAVKQAVADLPKSDPANDSSANSSGNGKSNGDKSAAEKTIRVDVDKLDRLIDLAGELVLEKNRLNQVSNEISTVLGKGKRTSDLGAANNSLRYLTKEIQEGVMQLRMLPIAHAFKRFPRLVRDLTRSGEKKIELTITGEDTNLDRSVIEAIGDPLVHLVRNSVDHGIETVAERLAKGKSEAGHVLLGAYQEGNHIIIEIKDDGAGINVAKVRAKAISKGFITQDESDRMSDQEVGRLVFAPGLSTAAKVTDISGRGVGMDVVATNISKLNGSIDVKWVENQGTTFTIKLPLTLTITAGMVIRVGHELYILPQISVAESIRLTPGMLDSIQGNDVLRLRESVIPVIHMKKLFSVPPEEDSNDSKGRKRNDEYIVIVSNADKMVGLVVSELVVIEETLVKSMGDVLGKVPFIAGATIRGDGRVVLILDVGDLVTNGLQA